MLSRKGKVPVFRFVSSCKEVNRLGFVLQVITKKLTYCQLLTTFRKNDCMFVVILLNVFLDLILFSKKSSNDDLLLNLQITILKEKQL